MRYISILIFSILLHLYCYTQNTNIDVQHYKYQLTVSDSTNNISVTAGIRFTFLQTVSSVEFDLHKIDSSKKGMLVTAVTSEGKPVSFVQQSEKLQLHFNTSPSIGTEKVVEIIYHGTPANGLIISKNKYGYRTIFGDNWPNRAHHWLVSNDYPSDKATVEFIVTAPQHYQVISNGLQVEETNINSTQKLTHYFEAIAIPTKVMVIGLADFAVQYSGNINCTPVYSWVYPQDREKGLYDYAIAKDILQYFNDNIGPYSYEKLANVQSTTMFGGMENAGAIFYGETTITGNRSNEALLAHEIAHQWFGNSVTEKSFEHLWLSEGFATCFTNLYLESKYGLDSLNKRLQQERAEAIAFSKKTNAPVINPTQNYMSLLNAFSYQKGGWVLHMLRRKLGDEIFWKSIRTYYKTYQNSNASTEDLKNIFEEVSGQQLDTFFHQWLYDKNHPVLNIHWKYDAGKKNIQVTIIQTQPNVFTFPLDIQVVNEINITKHNFNITQKETVLTIPINTAPAKIIADPDTNLFFEYTIVQ